MGKNIPTIPSGMLVPGLQTLRRNMGRVLKKPRTLPPPFNFRITPQRGGNLLAWDRVDGADGYEIMRSDDGTFDENSQVVPVTSPDADEHYDAIPLQETTLPTRHYRIRSTAGTAQQPHSIKGVWSGAVSSAPLDPNDDLTVPATAFDAATSDELRASARSGAYGDRKFEPDREV